MPPTEYPVAHRSIMVNGIQMHYATAGSGPPLLLLHGFPEFWYSWRHQVAALAPHHTLIMPDQRGYGQTDKPGWGYSIDVLVADMVELIQALGYAQVGLIGHDWGGAVAWAAAIAYPQRFARLAVLNAPHPAIFAEHLRGNPRQMLRSAYMGFFALPLLPELALRAGDYAAIGRVLRDGRGDAVFSDEDVDAYKDAISTPGALTAALGWYRAAARQGSRGLYSGTGMRCRLPTLLVWGEDDRFLGSEMVAGTERFVPDLTVRRIPGCSHWVQQERPAEVNRALREHFQPWAERAAPPVLALSSGANR